jgi:hypothetical protein
VWPNKRPQGPSPRSGNALECAKAVYIQTRANGGSPLEATPGHKLATLGVRTSGSLVRAREIEPRHRFLHCPLARRRGHQSLSRQGSGNDHHRTPTKAAHASQRPLTRPHGDGRSIKTGVEKQLLWLSVPDTYRFLWRSTGEWLTQTPPFRAAMRDPVQIGSPRISSHPSKLNKCCLNARLDGEGAGRGGGRPARISPRGCSSALSERGQGRRDN